MVFSVIHRLAKGLAKSRERLGDMLDLAVGRGVFDDEAAEGIEEALILADAGPEQAEELARYLKQWVSDAGGGLTVETVKEALALQIARMLDVSSSQPVPDAANPPVVTLIVGVNGTGKTTTAAKIAARDMQDGKKIVLGAADTFRAAAADQLKIWGDRIGADVVAQPEGADPAAVAFDAVQAGISRHADRVIIDTAGRLHTKVNLMNELDKICRVVRKLRDPIEILLVLDGSVGQNGILQVESFARSLPLSGLVITKLDGTAKAGVVIQAARRFSLPIRFIGVGETAEDLLPFDAEQFAHGLVNG